MFTVIDELAQRVAERSPPSKLTSTASAFVMLSTLSVSVLISSREYIMGPASLSKRRAYEESDALSSQCPAHRRGVRVPCARHAEAVRLSRSPVSCARARRHDDGRRGNHRDNWWHFDVAGTVHQAGGVLRVGADGGRLFHAARTARVLADRERRRAGGAVLLPLAFLLRRRPRPDQRRRAA